jgi:hypothetical protein
MTIIVVIFDSCSLGVLQSHSAAHSKKVKIQQRIAFGIFRVFAFDNAN